MDQEKLVHSFPKNALEEVRVYLKEFKGRNYINLRIFARVNDGSVKPTQKGMTLSVDLFDNLAAAVDALRAEISNNHEAERR